MYWTGERIFSNETVVKTNIEGDTGGLDMWRKVYESEKNKYDFYKYI